MSWAADIVLFSFCFDWREKFLEVKNRYPSFPDSNLMFLIKDFSNKKGYLLFYQYSNFGIMIHNLNINFKGN